ncbi:MAG: rhomboid family intramembrane serine protease [Chloroflexi bacterium]|nr:rhomboid family intramembrane serine protease [Chloroflexota bacterium]
MSNTQTQPPTFEPPPGNPHPAVEDDSAPSRDSRPQGVTVKMPDLKPYITYAILGLTIFIYLLQMGSESLLGSDLPAYYGLKVNELIAAGQLWRLITPVLLHGSALHIGFNMYALYLFGPSLEKHFGHMRFLALYLLAGFGGNVFSMMFTDAPSLGSSTAIFGLMGAHGIFIYQNRELFGKQTARMALNQIMRIAGINLLIGLSPGIDNWGHVGGLIGGALFAWFGGPILEVSGIYPNLRLEDQRTVDQVIQAAAIVGGFIGFLAAGALFLMN